jgi:hypothetical protein
MSCNTDPKDPGYLTQISHLIALLQGLLVLEYYVQIIACHCDVIDVENDD